MELDERIVDAIRSKYQYEMKSAVANIARKVRYNPSGEIVNGNVIDAVDEIMGKFMAAKEKATHFEAIIKNLKVEENDKN